MSSEHTHFYTVFSREITEIYQRMGEIELEFNIVPAVDATFESVEHLHDELASLDKRLLDIRRRLDSHQSITRMHLRRLVVQSHAELSEENIVVIQSQVGALQQVLDEITLLKNLVRGFEQNAQQNRNQP